VRGSRLADIAAQTGAFGRLGTPAPPRMASSLSAAPCPAGASLVSQDPPAAAIAKLWARAQLARELARVLPSSALARRLLDIANELEAEAAALERQQDPP
jgi:hypothetical protein